MRFCFFEECIDLKKNNDDNKLYNFCFFIVEQRWTLFYKYNYL